MKVKLIKEISTLKKKNIPKKILNHINDAIDEHSKHIKKSYEDYYNYNTIETNDFKIFKWLINNKKYYDICHHFVYDAEIGYLVRFNGDKIKKVCEIDEASVNPILENTKYDKLWCDKFEKKRCKILDL